jgi:hypothetical protein
VYDFSGATVHSESGRRILAGSSVEGRMFDSGISSRIADTRRRALENKLEASKSI